MQYGKIPGTFGNPTVLYQREEKAGLHSTYRNGYSEEMRLSGKICDWRDDKGFGFIAPDNGGNRVFAHARAFANRQRRPEIGAQVTYLAGTDERGRPCAVKIAFDGERYAATPSKRRSRPAGRSNGPVLFAILFVAVLAAATAAGWLPLAVVGLYAATSAIAFLAYALDKSAARQGAWRTQESTLHGLALVGGWPGALIAQRWLRHKSSKSSFQTMFWITVALNCGGLAWLLTPAGNQSLNRLLAALRSML